MKTAWKKTGILLMALVLVLGLTWIGLGGKAQAAEDVPELVDDVYHIYTADQLYWFADQLNGGATAIDGKLMADIVVNENVLKADGTLNGDGSGLRSWEPIVDYMGTFDGNGKTISGLYISDSDADTVDHIGLFSSVGADGVVRNLTIDDSYMSGDNSGDDLAGVVAVHNAGTIENCGNRGTVTNYYSGGIVYKNEGTISRCVNSGNIHGYYAGGIAANNQGTISNCYNIGKVGSGDWVGGIVGYNAGAVANCYNAVSIVGESAGGVALCPLRLHL